MFFYSRRAAVFLCAALLCFSYGSAQSDSQTASQQDDELILTTDDAVKYAVEGNLSLKESAISVSSAKRASDNSWNSVNPSINAGYSFSPIKAPNVANDAIRPAGEYQDEN